MNDFRTVWLLPDTDRMIYCVSVFFTRCGDEALEKLMFSFGSSRSEECHGAVVELLERVTRLHKELKLKESRAEMNMDQVHTTSHDL